MRIICSIGPNIKNIDKLKDLSVCGMNMVRFNMSHIDKDETSSLIKSIRKNLPDIQIIADLQGHKVRVSQLFDNELSVSENDQILFCHENTYKKLYKSFPNSTLIPIQFDSDFKKLLSSETIYMKDGTMEFSVRGYIKEEVIAALVTKGGVIRREKGLNFPCMDRSHLGLSKKDIKDISWSISNNVDIICLSFVSSVEDILECQKLVNSSSISKKDNNSIKIWAKIETKEGIDNIDSIAKIVDGIMLGRGDLCAEIGIYNIPKYQNLLLDKFANSNKEFIIATYVLDSMKKNRMPSVSECMDIYNSVKKNVSGFMLAGEVGIGNYPIEVLIALKHQIEAVD